MITSLDAPAQRTIHEHSNFQPTDGSRIRLHEYDGWLPDFSAAWHGV